MWSSRGRRPLPNERKRASTPGSRSTVANASVERGEQPLSVEGSIGVDVAPGAAGLALTLAN